MEPLEKLIETIANESGRSLKDVARLVEEKKDELSGLVSEEGAAYIVGRELGVSLLKEGKRLFKIKNLGDGLRSVDLVARVIRVSEVREFEREGKRGRVQSLVLGDDTGTIRLPLWNEEVDRFAGAEIREDDVVALSGGWVKLDNKGAPELRLGRGRIAKSATSDVPVREDVARAAQAERRDVAALKEGDAAEVRASVVQLFRRDPFFSTCPECGTRVFEQEGKQRCKEHGIVTPELQIAVSGILDDGTGNIRAVFFREQAERLLGENVLGLRQIADKEKNPLALYDRFSGMGRDMVVRGRVKKNEFMGGLELVVSAVEEADPRAEARRLLVSEIPPERLHKLLDRLELREG